jgi:hypothetical protein
MPASDYMRPNDVKAFLEGAANFHVWILLRASNPEAKQYIGVPGYRPKRLDCKAKTAKRNVNLPGGLGEKKTAGLVVNPTIPGMAAAFDDLDEALETWSGFKDKCDIPKPGALTPYFPGGKFYSVQMDPSHERYGCVIFSDISNRAHASYIHSDYDLYGIVPEKDPTANVRVVETRLDEKHSRSQEFFDLQHYLNKRMGVPMILHGAQETYKEDWDDKLDVFCPDGRNIIQAYGADAIQRLYKVTFRGRRLYGSNANPKPFFGKWQILGPES